MEKVTDTNKFIAYLKKKAPQYYPETKHTDWDVRLLDVINHRASTFYRCGLSANGFQKKILIKTAPSYALPKRLSAQTPPVEKFKLEFDALDLIYNHFSSTDKHNFRAIRVFEFLPAEVAIVMEECDAPGLKKLLLNNSRLHPFKPRRDLNPAFFNSGGWLRHFHALLPADCAGGNNLSTCSHFIQQFTEKISFIQNEIGHSNQLKAVNKVVVNTAGTALPDDLEMGLKHGDFAPRNIMVDAENKIIGIDTLAKSMMPVHYDIAYLVVQLQTSKLQLYTQGAAFGRRRIASYERALMKGYWQDDSGKHSPALELFKAFVLLEKWGTQIHRNNNVDSGARGKIKARAERALANRLYLKLLAESCQKLAVKAG